MAVSDRVADERDEVYLDYVTGGNILPGRTRLLEYMIVKRGKMYRLHENGCDFPPTTNARQVVVGAIVRRYDPGAGDQEGKPAKFETPQECEAYAKRWL